MALSSASTLISPLSSTLRVFVTIDVMATVDDEKGKRYAADPKTYVWQEGASVISEALATGKEPLINVEHALHVLEIIEAARASQETGKRIELQSTFKFPIV